MADVNRRTAVGFEGGQVLALKVPEEQLTNLRDSLRKGDEGWYEVTSSEGAVLIDLGEVVYLRVESDEHRVGF